MNNPFYTQKMNRTVKDYFFIYLKGMAMGAADIVPGVSGGTIALISGIYEELVHTIAGFNPSVLLILKNEGIKACWQKSNASFLATLVAGILTSIFTLAKIIKSLLDTQPLTVWGFFFGLVLASVFILYQQISHWVISKKIAAIAGFLCALLIVFTTNFSPQHISLAYVFFCATIAICAMILPGISGSFILVLMGAYAFILDAIHHFDLPVLIVFAAGSLIGLLTFSNFLKWLFTHHRDYTLAVLLGFITGSLAKIWPWRESTEHLNFFHAYLLPTCLIVLGILFVMILDRYGNNHHQSSSA